MKKIICLILCLTFAFGAFSAAAATTDADYDNAEGLFLSLGITDRSFETNRVVTRAEFVHLCTELMKLYSIGSDSLYASPVFTDVSTEHVYYEELMTAYSLSYIYPDSNGRFRPDSPLNFGDAQEILLNFMGYKDIRTLYPESYKSEYTRLGSSLKLYKNISGASGSVMTGTMCVNMMYNALFCGLPGNFSSDNILMQIHGVYMGKGVLTSDIYFSTTNDTANTNCVVIDGVEYYCGARNLHSFIGKSVKFYCRERPDERCDEIIHIYEHDNTEAELYGENIKFEGNTLTDRENKSKNYKINSKTSVIYNNRLISSDEYDDVFSLPQSRIRLIDNDNDKIYDVAIIEAAKIIEVDTYNPSTQTLTSTAGDSYKLDDYKRGLVLSYYGDVLSNTVVFNAGMVLSVIDPESLDGLISFRICDKTISAAVTGISYDDFMITLDGGSMELDISRNSITPPEKFVIGSKYTLYLDNYGEVVFARYEGNNSYNIGYISYIDKDRRSNPKLTFEIFTVSGSMAEYEVAEGVKYRDLNGEFQKGSDLKALYNYLTSDGASHGRQPIAYKLSSDNKIKEFLLVAPEDRTDLIFRLIDFKSDKQALSDATKYNKGDNSFGKRIKFTDTTNYFIVPNNSFEHPTKDDYMKKSLPQNFLRIGASYNISETGYYPIPITMEENGFLTDYFYFQYPSGVGRLNNMPAYNLNMVMGMKNIYNEVTGETEKHLELLTYSGSVTLTQYTTTDDSGELKDINGETVSFGAIILCNKTYDGSYQNGTMQLYYRASDGKFFREAAGTFTEYATYRIAKMRVGRKSGLFCECTCLHADNTEVREILDLSGVNVYTYNRDKKTVTKEGQAVNNLSAGDEVLMIMNGGRPSIIVKEE